MDFQPASHQFLTLGKTVWSGGGTQVPNTRRVQTLEASKSQKVVWWSRDGLLLWANPLLANWPSGHTGRRDREENSRQSVGVRQLVDEATVKDCDTREEMKGLILFGSQQET